MDVKELQKDERIALLGLLKLMIQADKEMSNEEGRELNRVAEVMGPDLWKATKQEAMETLRTVEDIRRQAEKVERAEARELIYELVFDMALPGSVVDSEREELDWLVKLWGIES